MKHLLFTGYLVNFIFPSYYKNITCIHCILAYFLDCLKKSPFCQKLFSCDSIYVAQQYVDVEHVVCCRDSLESPWCVVSSVLKPHSHSSFQWYWRKCLLSLTDRHVDFETIQNWSSSLTSIFSFSEFLWRLKLTLRMVALKNDILKSQVLFVWKLQLHLHLYSLVLTPLEPWPVLGKVHSQG